MSDSKAITWDSVIHNVMPQFERIARDKNLVRWQEESQFALQSIQKNPMLSQCTAPSVQNAIVNVAAVGLTLNPSDGYAYLVPEYNKKARVSECQLRISFKGLIKVATDSGSISWVKAEIVKANDTFDYNGPCSMPRHTMNPFGDRGDTVGVYCIAKTNEADYLIDLIGIEELKKIQSCAKQPAVWNSWFDEMAKKAVIKRASKQWPKTNQSERLNKTIDVVNESEGGFDPYLALESSAAEILSLIGDGSNPDLIGIAQIWQECTEQEKSTLWTAKTKGGWFTSEDKEIIRAAAAAFFNEKGETNE